MDLAKCQGFVCQWIAPGEDGPLFARRETLEYRGLPVTERVTGDAFTVLCTVISDWSTGRPVGRVIRACACYPASLLFWQLLQRGRDRDIHQRESDPSAGNPHRVVNPCPNGTM